MTPQQLRRRDPVVADTGWEIAVLIAAGVAITISLAAMVGLAVSGFVFGRGWVWPHGVAMDHTLGGLLTGRPGRGLTPAAKSRLPGRHVVYSCVAGTEALLLALCFGGLALFLRYRTPGDHRSGMATRREAARVLGLRRLREAAHLIRPDLPPRRPRCRGQDRTPR